MAESTTTTEITEAEWRAARASGLLFADPGSNAQDKAIHAFAEAIRVETRQDSAEVLSALIELVDLVQEVINGEYKPDSFTLQPAHAAIHKATRGRA